MPSSGISMTPGTGPYVGGMGQVKGQPGQSQSPSYTVGSQAVRATGTGPFDAAYRQNLATYAGGQFQNPGVLSFNPTAQPGQAGALGGQATGYGSAPVQGGPNSLLGMALGGQAYSTPNQQPSAPAPSTSTSGSSSQPTPIWQQPGWQQWLNSLTNQGGLLRGY
jgi:hypothetical protein